MARVIILLGFMVVVTAAMFWLTRRPPANPAPPGNATVTLADLKTPLADQDATRSTKEATTQSVTSAEPRRTEEVTKQETAPSAQEVTNGAAAGAAPVIGTAGIDRAGNASFTGTASPGEAVTLVWDDKPMSWTAADAAGKWAIEFKAPVGDREHELFASARDKQGNVLIGPQRVYVAPAERTGGLASITLRPAERAKPSTKATAAREGREPKTGIIVEKVTGGESGQTILSGKADPEAKISATINGKPAGEIVVSPDGSWALAATNPSGKAADAIGLQLFGADGAALDETKVPYKIAATQPQPAPGAAGGKTAEPMGPPATVKRPDTTVPVATTSSAAAERPKRQVVRVRKGDSLWRIAKRYLGDGRKWQRFYKLNKRKIDNPDLIFPGQTLVIPS